MLILVDCEPPSTNTFTCSLFLPHKYFKTAEPNYLHTYISTTAHPGKKKKSLQKKLILLHNTHIRLYIFLFISKKLLFFFHIA